MIQKMKKEKIDNETIIEYETELSMYNRKTLSISEFKEYIQEKNFINYTLFEFYNRNLFKKLKFSGFINKTKSEQRMMKNFERKFGRPEEVVVCFGDWEQKKQMKYKEPTKGKGMRNLFRKYRYKVFLVDEFRTSCKCSSVVEIVKNL